MSKHRLYALRQLGTLYFFSGMAPIVPAGERAAFSQISLHRHCLNVNYLVEY